ncbi:hypothetical protein SALBM311S_01203 [Streptomyces alboniger]
MCPTPASAGRHWDGSPRAAHRPRSLRVTATSTSRLLRAGQHGRCRHCGNRIDLYPRTDQRPIALHPAELTAAQVPESCRWHLSCGIAHPHGDGSAWCRIPHAVLCPRRTPTCRMSPCLEAARRQLAVRTRRLTDTGAFIPAPPPGGSAPGADIPDRPVVQLLLCRYVAERPVRGLRCVAQTRHRCRCTNPVLAPAGPAGTLETAAHRPPARPTRPARHPDGRLRPGPPPLRRAAARWRTQHCPAHAAAPGVADLALTGWQPFDPFLHAAHIRPCLPHPPSRRHGRG